MATQPSRPWFRLATMARPPPPPTQQPDPAPPPPRPAFIRPAFTQAPPAVPRPPNVVAPTSPPVAKAIPSPTVSKAPMAAPAMTRVSTPTVAKTTPSPTVSKASRVSSTPPPAISQPPSPLVLPPPQPEYEQKTVLMQETKGLDNGKNVGWGSYHPKGKNNLDSDDVGMRIITVAGENKGAIMDLTPFSKKKDNPTPSSDGESNAEGKKKKNQKIKLPLMRAIMNSNVQGVNNSILYNSSTNHHDPGVHVSLSRKPNSGTK